MPTLTFLPFGMRSPRVRPKIRLFDRSVIINPLLTLNCHTARLTTVDRTRWPQQPSSTSGAPSPFNLADQRIVAFFVPERGGCAVNAVTWRDTGSNAPYASTRVRIILKPGQIMQIDGAQPHAMGLLCGADASNLAAIAPAELIIAGSVEKD